MPGSHFPPTPPRQANALRRSLATQANADLKKVTSNKKLLDWVAQRTAQLKPAKVHIVNGSAEVGSCPRTLLPLSLLRTLR